MNGTARMTGPNRVEVTTANGIELLTADAVLIATGSRPRIPDWCHPDGERILTTRDCYPPQEFPTSMTVVGSGVTGVEFVHMFSSFGSAVTLVVSRQQVLPQQGPRGRRGPGGRLPATRCALAEGCAGNLDRACWRRGRGQLRRWACCAQQPCGAGDWLGAEHRRSQPGSRRSRSSTKAM